ncbi:MAG: hypothetical protein ABW224_21665 [Kibdelosporangium sp.]
MAQQRPMSTPIFDELLREYSIRMEEHRGAPDQPDSAMAPVVPPPTGPPAGQTSQAAQTGHRHRAD